MHLNPEKAQVGSLALLQLGGAEIVLILVLLFIFAVVLAVIAGVVYLVVRLVQSRPPAVPSTLPPQELKESLRKRDEEHLKLLSIFHFVFAGLALLGMAFLLMHYAMMHTIFANPDTWKAQKNVQPPPKEFFEAFIWFYLFMGVIMLIALSLNVLSGLFLRQRRHRVFSLVIAGLNCLQIPFGTTLGVFTIIVLVRDSVQELYSQEPGGSG